MCQLSDRVWFLKVLILKKDIIFALVGIVFFVVMPRYLLKIIIMKEIYM